MKKEVIIVGVMGQDIRFKPTLEAFNKLTNESTPFDKIGPATNYLRRIVVKEDKEHLANAEKLPGAIMQMATLVNNEYQGDLEIEVKN